jgi:hypothetical protein
VSHAPLRGGTTFGRLPYVKCEGTVTAGPLFVVPAGPLVPPCPSPRMSPPASPAGDRPPPSRPSPVSHPAQWTGRTYHPKAAGDPFSPYVKTDPHHQQKASFVPPGPSRRASFDRNSLLAAVAGSYASSVGQAASLSPCPMFHRASESGTGAGKLAARPTDPAARVCRRSRPLENVSE